MDLSPFRSPMVYVSEAEPPPIHFLNRVNWGIISLCIDDHLVNS
jgi:hypothetical protein